MRATTNRTKYQHSLSPANGRPIRTIKPVAGTIPPNLRQLPARRLGQVATDSPIRPQFVAQYNYWTNPVRPPYRIYATDQGKPTNDKHTRNRTPNSPPKNPSRPGPDRNQTHPGNDTKIRRTKERTTPFPTIRRRTTSMARRNEPSLIASDCQITPQTFRTLLNYQDHQPLCLLHQAASSLEDIQCLPRLTSIRIH